MLHVNAVSETPIFAALPLTSAQTAVNSWFLVATNFDFGRNWAVNFKFWTLFLVNHDAFPLQLSKNYEPLRPLAVPSSHYRAQVLIVPSASSNLSQHYRSPSPFLKALCWVPKTDSFVIFSSRYFLLTMPSLPSNYQPRSQICLASEITSTISFNTFPWTSQHWSCSFQIRPRKPVFCTSSIVINPSKTKHSLLSTTLSANPTFPLAASAKVIPPTTDVDTKAVSAITTTNARYPVRLGIPFRSSPVAVYRRNVATTKFDLQPSRDQLVPNSKRYLDTQMGSLTLTGKFRHPH